MTPERRWHLAVEGPPPGGGQDAELICHGLEASAERLEELRSYLSADELARAERFHFPALRSRFVVARGRLREILASRLDVAPASLQFRYGPHGKPELDGHPATSGLRFNLSHSGGLALLGLCAGREIGVDIEAWRTLRAEESLARRCFAAGEFADYLSLPAHQRTEGFFNGWSRKEAFIKALGRGLSLPLHSFEVELRPGRAPRLRSWRREEAGAGTWTLATIDAGERCAAAVIVEGDHCHITAIQ